jgi:DNA-binding NarL/FixJ family response regulator
MRPVAVFNHHRDTLEHVALLLAEVGIPTATAAIQAIRRGDLDLDKFMRRHDPAVIVFDVTYPYLRAWQELITMRKAHPLFAEPPFILLTTNHRAVAELSSGSCWVHAVVQKPVDRDALVTAIERVRTDPPRRSR